MHNASLLASRVQLQMACIGEKAPQIAKAVANGYVNFMTQVVKVSTVDVGTAGPKGDGTGKLAGPLPATCGALCAAYAPANGILGSHGLVIAQAVGFACGEHTLLMGEVVTSHAGVAIGAGTGALVGATPAALYALFQQEAVAQGLLGESRDPLFWSLAKGLAEGVVVAAIVVTIVGAPAGPPPVPGAGTGSGSVL